MAIVREKLYECEVKRRRIKASGARGYEAFWKIKNVAEAVVDGDTEFRCKDCHGDVKLFKRNAPTVLAHVEHRSSVDSEFCASSVIFHAATDGREPRISARPVR